jgi:peptidyl-prolyl cis-trans isomerase B (cyclophilin B)
VLENPNFMTNPTVNIHTTKGDMTLELWSAVAPKPWRISKTRLEGFYNGTCFHRIVKGFMIQGATLTKDENQKSMWGTGGPGYQIKAEFNDRSHQLGVISMARSANPDSAGSQFFICLGDESFLDGQYTAFGKVVKGEDVLKAIGNTPTADGLKRRYTPLLGTHRSDFGHGRE